MKGADYNKVEKKMAKKDGADVVKNSGRGERKGDARTDTLLIDYKFTGSKSFSLNIEKFHSHQKDAWRENRDGIFVLVFEEYNGKRVAVIDWDLLQEMMEDEE